jgi:trimeric autotransporter adhesin
MKKQFLLVLLVWAAGATAQTVQQNLWATNGTVRTVVRNGNTIYLGGSFSKVGPNTGGGAGLNISSDTTDGTFPAVTGEVKAVVSDGNGGWYIGGDFTAVGGVARSRIAHIKPDKSLDLTWSPFMSVAVLTRLADRLAIPSPRWTR